MFKLRSTFLTVAATMVGISAFPASARDVDWKRFPSFQYFDVDKRIGVSAPAPSAPTNVVRRDVAETQGGIFVVNQKLRDFLILAGRRFGIQITVSSGIKGVIQNQALPGDLDGILNTLSSQFEFAWYRENNAIRVTSSKDSASRVIYLGRMSYEELVTAIAEAGIKPDGYELSHIESSNSVSLNGPAELIAKVELIAEAYNKRNSGVRLIKRGRES
ncbi:MAG: hypothetical protein R3D34_17265 [Nitratireductor sp.]